MNKIKLYLYIQTQEPNEPRKNGQIYFQLPNGTITQEIPKEYRRVN